jgi:hypothetical protein
MASVGCCLAGFGSSAQSSSFKESLSLCVQGRGHSCHQGYTPLAVFSCLYLQQTVQVEQLPLLGMRTHNDWLSVAGRILIQYSYVCLLICITLCRWSSPL